ncbi:MAG: F0F1 ATP synthase subunit epsilon, partial [Candidatus Methylumidiphilus sp.]
TLSDRSGKLDYAKAQLELIEAVAQLRTLERYRKNR